MREGRFRNVAVAFGWFSLGVGSFLFVSHLQPNIPSPHSDAWDYAQLARNNLDGDWFLSDFTYPVAYGLDPEPPYFTLWRLPVYPLILTFVFQFEPLQRVEALRWVSGFFFAWGALLIGILTRRLLSEPWAWAAVGLYCLSPAMFQPGLRGLSEPVYVALVLAACGALFREERRWDLAAGLLLGLSWLTRSNTLFLFPGVALCLSLRTGTIQSKAFSFAWALGGAAAVCLPWWLRNVWAVGDPFLNVSSNLVSMFTPTWPGWSLFRTVVPEGGAAPIAPWNEILEKGIRNLWDFAVVRRIAFVGPLLIFYYWGVVQAFIRRVERPVLWRLAAFTAASETLLVVALSFVNPDLRIYSCLLPLVIVVALFPLASSPWGRIGFLVLLTAASISTAHWSRNIDSGGWNQLSNSEARKVLEIVPSGGVILSDVADYLAWTLDRPTLVLPTPESIERVPGILRNVVAVHLSPEAAPFLARESPSDRRWVELVEGKRTLHWVGDLLLETDSGHKFFAVSRLDAEASHGIIPEAVRWTQPNHPMEQ